MKHFGQPLDRHLLSQRSKVSVLPEEGAKEVILSKLEELKATHLEKQTLCDPNNSHEEEIELRVLYVAKWQGNVLRAVEIS